MSFKFKNGFEQVCLIDFTAGGDEGPFTNGVNRSIAGSGGWKIENCGGSVGAIENVNTAGLELSTGTSASDLIDSTRTSVIASSKITSLAPQFDWSKYSKLRASIIFSSGDMVADNRGLIFAIAKYGAGAATDSRLECNVQRVTSVKYYAKSNFSGVTLGTNGQVNSNTDDILQLTIDLDSYGLGIATTYTSVGSLIPSNIFDARVRGTFSPTSGSISEPLVSMDELCILFSAVNPAGGIYTVDVQRLLIEAA